MPEIETSAGTIEYEDSGGDGAAVVLLHGVLMDAEQWRDVAPGLAGEHRVIRPTLPLGAHRRPMRPEADLSLRGQAHLVAELLERLDLRDALDQPERLTEVIRDHLARAAHPLDEA
jgi:pimeloyl-ACP methyl ester carboxylesterase